MLKKLAKLLFITAISISLTSGSLIFAEKDNPQKFAKDYEQYLRQIAADTQKTQTEIEVVIPKREGYDNFKYGSGTIIAKTTLEVESYSDKVTENIVYFIHTNPHVITDMEIVLKEYKEARIRIYIIGRKGSRVEAEVVAWNWATAGLLLRAVISQERVEDFKFEVAKISNRLPISSMEEKFSDDLLAEIIYAAGYPYSELADSCGKVSKYIDNETIKTSSYSFRLLKTMHMAFKGLVGSGQSGGGIFMVNDKTGKPEWIGTTTLGLNQLTIGIPIDVTVTRFLKQVPDIRDLIDFPEFELSDMIRDKGVTVVYDEVSKNNNN